MPAQMRDSWGNWTDVDELVNTGGEQTVRLLGPFHIAHDTPGLYEGLLLDDTADPDAWVFSAWAIVTEAFDNVFSNLFNVGRIDDDLVAVGRFYIPADNVSDENQGIIDSALSGPWRVGPGLAVCMPADDPPVVTTGEADIYALIAEPA